MVTEGWSDLRSFYDFNSHKLCFLKHVGNSNFEIQFYQSCGASTITKFLDDIRSNAPLTVSKLIHFEIRLRKYNYKASFLVSLMYSIFLFTDVIEMINLAHIY